MTKKKHDYFLHVDVRLAFKGEDDLVLWEKLQELGEVVVPVLIKALVEREGVTVNTVESEAKVWDLIK